LFLAVDGAKRGASDQRRVLAMEIVSKWQVWPGGWVGRSGGAGRVRAGETGRTTAGRVAVARGDLFGRMSSAELADLPPFHPRER
jgi:hypothetical protein